VLAENSSKLTTFATPFGRYRFLRLPFDVSNAPKIFHRTFTEIFGDIKGVKIYIDDIIIHAKNEEEHDEILRQVCKRVREYGVRFNMNKCKFKEKQVRYVGHITLSENGIGIDEEKIEAIKRISEPTNAKELSRFLRDGNICCKVYSELIEFNFEFKSANGCYYIKKNLKCSNRNLAPVLRYFDKNK